MADNGSSPPLENDGAASEGAVEKLKADVAHWRGEAARAAERRDSGIQRAQDSEARLAELEKEVNGFRDARDKAEQQKLEEKGDYEKAMEAQIQGAVKAERLKREAVEKAIETLQARHREVVIQGEIFKAAAEAKAALPGDITRQLVPLFSLDPETFAPTPDEKAWEQLGVTTRDEEGKVLDLKGLTQRFIEADPNRQAAVTTGGGAATRPSSSAPFNYEPGKINIPAVGTPEFKTLKENLQRVAEN